jgi:hypothetical protein
MIHVQFACEAEVIESGVALPHKGSHARGVVAKGNVVGVKREPVFETCQSCCERSSLVLRHALSHCLPH